MEVIVVVEVVVAQVEVEVKLVVEIVKEVVVQTKEVRVAAVGGHLVILLVSKVEILEVAVEDLKNALRRQ